MLIVADKLLTEIFGQDGLRPSPDEQLAIQARLWKWLAEEARKKPGVDMSRKAEIWARRLRELTSELHLVWKDGNPEIHSTGTASQTLKFLRYGDDWFQGCDDLDGMILQAWLQPV